jgi:hypothetical protein
MQIVETIIINRANTTIDWPSTNVPEDPNSPWPTANCISTSEISSDTLTKTTVRVWSSKEEFVTVHAYVGPNTTFYFDSITTIGITHSRIIETTKILYYER